MSSRYRQQAATGGQEGASTLSHRVVDCVTPRLRQVHTAMCAEPSNLPSHGSLPGVNTSAAAPPHALTPSPALLPKLVRAQHLRQPSDAQAAGTCSRAA